MNKEGTCHCGCGCGYKPTPPQEPKGEWEEEWIKICKNCKEPKPLHDFFRQAATSDGHQARCKDCEKIRAQKKYEASKEIRKSQMRENFEANRSLYYQRQSVLAKKYPDRTKARQAVSNAVYRKELVKSPCVFCANVKSEAHHPDYSRPLDVVWMCRRCHRILHAQISTKIKEAELAGYERGKNEK
jgi:hypothetical protein